MFEPVLHERGLVIWPYYYRITKRKILNMKHSTDTAELPNTGPVDSPQQMDVETPALCHSLQDSQVPDLPNEILIRITHKHSVMYICR